MYDRLARNNPKNAGDEFVCFDNRKENVGVAERYNSFLDSYDYESPAWFVFCHEDWETKEDLTEKLSGLAYEPEVYQKVRKLSWMFQPMTKS